ncbi:MAG: hypothetical protein ACFFCH_08675 [Promethearchaeota archaeon]
MKTSGKVQLYKNVENKAITRLLLLVLIILAVSCIFCAVILPEIAWVLLICILYLSALEAILFTSN